MAKVGFSVDALHIIEQVHAEATVPGIAFGLAMIHGLLQKVASRAITLGDAELLGYMERMHLVEKGGAK